MTRLLRFIATLVRWLRRSSAEREAEIVYLRRQLIVLKRSAPARPRLKATDRPIFVCLYRLFPSLIDASIVDALEEIVGDAVAGVVNDFGNEMPFSCLLISVAWRRARPMMFKSSGSNDSRARDGSQSAHPLSPASRVSAS